MRAKPKDGTVRPSITNPTEFAICVNCGKDICREYVGEAGETYWNHRYESGRPVTCPPQ